MAKVTVRMFATVREAARVPECTVEAEDIESLLTRLVEKYGPKLRSILGSSEKSSENIVILHNGRNVRQHLGTVRLRDGDEVAIFPPVSGG